MSSDSHAVKNDVRTSVLPPRRYLCWQCVRVTGAGRWSSVAPSSLQQPAEASRSLFLALSPEQVSTVHVHVPTALEGTGA